MKCLDTRGGPSVALSEAIASGLAPSGGLYVPASMPAPDRDRLAAADTLATVARTALHGFFADDPLADALPAICNAALSFEAPLRSLPQANTQVLELFHGPTAAFKDFGARFLAACLARIRDPAETTTILVATSGDTGAAVAAAFHRQPGVRVVILYPDGRVAARQAHQLGCFGDNIHCYRVAGNFDDCQRLVKSALHDQPLRQCLRLSSANSISLGRLLPQLSYYAWASLRHQRAGGRPLNLVIPTGNLGNALAAVMARRLGFPLERIVFATNANTVLADYFEGGDYLPQESIATLANAMDVGAPSNFERLRWWYEDDLHLRESFDAQAVSDQEISDVIAAGEQQYETIWCPHTATAVRVLERLRAQGADGDWAIVATAHPAKFETVVEPLIGHDVSVPPALQAMLERPSHSEPLAADEQRFRDELLRLAAA
ncbi:MAG: threonine synthase [Wenzhouxiangellaceae bacterium]